MNYERMILFFIGVLYIILSIFALIRYIKKKGKENWGSILCD